ncbi:AcrR family transcriptional regulator [Saccharothrix ecbatanensis]|uniref:AcrR family transcriptional regulator n=1 Tax=Saccharothrix ecbatanensis TaxID=1105145 RepID=A0A7W9HGU6_9PSEU|nr:TetR/AcrR family transcriptional regulator [Saccharothrix ecbatanensis]MBB5801713.1 AcrR family transcriptional regulator [Saccharothrix ecbatanensis]
MGDKRGTSWDVELAGIREAAPKERADAARNRAKILDVAARLFARHGVADVSMDQIASEAGVGKGTLFRRFGDKAGLASALLGAREEDLQGAILSGPPPLGPGAPAGERLIAFVTAYAHFLEANLDLVRLSETANPGARYRTGAYRFWRLHVRILLAEARPDLDADFFAHALLAPLAADLRHATGEELSAKRFADGIARLARSLSGPQL